VESTEHLIGTIQASANAKTTIWILPSELKLDTRKLTDGKSLYFTGPPGDYRLYEVAVNADSKAEPQTFERSVTIKPATPLPTPPVPVPPVPVPVPPKPPDPVPVPPAPPTPQPPAPGKYNVAPLVYDLAMKLPADAKAICPNVAAAFASLSADIALGKVGLLKIASETRTRLDAAYGAKARPLFLPIEAAAIAALKPQLKLNAANIAEAYGEVASGFGAVK
jgi:hypothetical protein